MQPLLKLEEVSKVTDYIKTNWQTLRRDHSHLLEAMADPKIPPAFNKEKVLYISGKEDMHAVMNKLESVLPGKIMGQVKVKRLPKELNRIKWHGLLYLPHPYVVPGGRFNEMYGWDSYFILLGLLHDGMIEAAQHLTDNALYQIEHYGKVLNANRTYSLDRSQPPLISQMVLALYRHTLDLEWVKKALPSIESHHAFWHEPPHGLPGLNLSRYYATSAKPAIEVIYSEVDERGLNHYQRVSEYFATHEVNDYPVKNYYDPNTNLLSAKFYRSDRSARESGFDPSSRFGLFGAKTTHFAPVCLNSLLYQMEIDISEIYKLLGDLEQSERWHRMAKKRAYAINYYLWDEDLGYYFDYNFIKKERRRYLFATTFCPVWAGIASAEQTQRLVQNMVALEAPGGLLTSAYVSGDQWDAPFGWAPLHYFAVKGLLRYDHAMTAERISRKFLALMTQEFMRCGSLFEKYDVHKMTSNVSNNLHFGYQSNEIGFGWTNGVYLELLHKLGLR